MTAATCRECGAEFDRAPGTPRVCGDAACLESFKARIVREGTPIARYAYPEDVHGDDVGVTRIKKAERRLARLTTKTPSIERDQAARKPERL